MKRHYDNDEAFLEDLLRRFPHIRIEVDANGQKWVVGLKLKDQPEDREPVPKLWETYKKSR